MSRPKKGTKGYEQSVKKWRETMERKYGGAEGVHKRMQKMGAAGGKISRGGGFADKEKARHWGAVGGRTSRRTDARYGVLFENNADKIKKMVQDGASIADIAREMGVPYSSSRYWLKNKFNFL